MYCYNCGAEVGNSKYCNNCGTDTQPPRDVYFVEEDCGDCDTPLPRWARACPKCGRKFNFTEPTDYSTEVQFDDGSKEIFNLENPADHIQLPIGSRVRYYLSTQSYRRI